MLAASRVRRDGSLWCRELGELVVEVSRLKRADSFALGRVLCRVAVQTDSVAKLR